jgi:hypothetical protein
VDALIVPLPALGIQINIPLVWPQPKSHLRQRDLAMADSGDDSELIFDSPPASGSPEKRSDTAQRFPESRYTTAEAREAALTQELENIRKINQVVEGVVDSLDKAKSNMEVRYLQIRV